MCTRGGASATSTCRSNAPIICEQLRPCQAARAPCSAKIQVPLALRASVKSAAAAAACTAVFSFDLIHNCCVAFHTCVLLPRRPCFPAVLDLVHPVIEFHRRASTIIAYGSCLYTPVGVQRSWLSNKRGKRLCAPSSPLQPSGRYATIQLLPYSLLLFLEAIQKPCGALACAESARCCIKCSPWPVQLRRNLPGAPARFQYTCTPQSAFLS